MCYTVATLEEGVLMERKLWALSVYRAWAGLSQEELAEISGVGRNTISRLENGQQSARPSTAKKLADALPYGCTPKDLMDLELARTAGE
jgi:transcriptional regulator with XRE-family HTH domain